ncbi:RagB/SusD family nutrient uptake outer membrane protein [Chitinophaga lutea]
MKKNTIIILALCLTGFASCKKWLEVTPKTEVKGTVLFSTQDGFRDALIGIYSLMTTTSSYGSDLTMSTTEVLGQAYDNVRTTAGHNFENVGKYLYTDAQVEARFAAIWRQQYKCIVNANIILANIDEKKSVFATGNYQLVKGEALALRGLLHFDLLRLFAPSALTGADKKAVPYVTAYTNVPVDQPTVAEAIGKIIKDLTDARELLRTVDTYGPDRATLPANPDNDLLRNRQYRMNYYAVTGLLARVYLYKGDKANALAAAKEVMASGLFPMFELNGGGVTTQPGDYVFPTEQLFCLKVAGLKDKYAATYFPELTVSNSPSAFTINNTTLTQLFPAGVNTDYRNNWFDVATSSAKRITKYNFNTIIPVLKMSEMYLIAAECEPDVQEGVKTYLNKLRAHRGLAGLDAAAATRATLDAEIMMEYRREFIAEGQLFFFYKRLNIAKLPPITQFADPAAVYVIPIPNAEIEFGNIQ